MNRQQSDILKVLCSNSYTNQRVLSEISGYSLGIVNQSLKRLVEEGFLNEDFAVTSQAKKELESNRPANAIILAAGYGMRMVPINLESPKAFMEVKKQPLIERIIEQLNEAGIFDISVVVGFMKEKFEYLIDKYDVTLIYNSMYSSKNNLHSLKIAADKLSNTYIIPCDIWCANNPFCRYELYSWYMVSNRTNGESEVRVSRKKELVICNDKQVGNSMIGIAYLTAEDSRRVRERLIEYDSEKKHTNSFWEEVLYENGKMFIQAKVVSSADVVEINTYEQLRELDEDSRHLNSVCIEVILKVLGVHKNEIVNIEVLKKGMTNRSFLFETDGKKYIMRVPGEGTDLLINRKEEALVYNKIKNKRICEDIIYIDSVHGYKITTFIENARVCDPAKEDDIRKCMKKLKEFHQLRLTVPHEFSLVKQIDFYEKLWNGVPSIFRDYENTKKNVLSLQSFINLHSAERCLTHIDAVPDNFLFSPNDNGTEEIYLIDWEYAAMQDPHVDIAMFCIYSLYDKREIDTLIDIYFDGNCEEAVRTKIYCYIATCGLLWSNWCEYKRSLGVEFGEYSLRQYRYAKDYYQIAKDRMGEG